jgi:hypothetical protein
VVAVLAVAVPSALLTAQLRPPIPGDPLPGVTPVQFELFRLGSTISSRSRRRKKD